MKHVRTRYAPSPTGFLHIGGARTALFSYLYAKHYNGDFVVRIEDTDLERNIEKGEDSQIDNLLWLGIIPDESPRKAKAQYGKYRQSEKIDRYNEIILNLIDKNLAYKAYDTPQEIAMQKQQQEEKGIFSFRFDINWLKISEEEKQRRDKNHEYTIRLRLSNNKVYKWNDLVRGEISVNTNDIGDFVIRKQNGYPTYNFAVVVDDYDMKITDVLRGEEHVANTPKQLAIYDSLNWTPPNFGHLTIITNMEGKKLSKRDSSIHQFIEDYKKSGYPPEAVFNFLTLLGWSDPEAKEIMTKEEIIAHFDWRRLSKSASKFDLNKMIWFAKSYIKMMDNKILAKQLKIPPMISNEWLTIFLNTYKQDVATYTDLQKILDSYQNLSIQQVEKQNEVVEIFAQELAKIPFTIENIKQAISNTKTKSHKKGKDLFMPLRQATTYKNQGPELAIDIWLTGEKTVKARIK